MKLSTFYCLLGLTFLQDLSADVTKLRLNDDIISKIANRREVWVNRNDGTIYEQNENKRFVNIETKENFWYDESQLIHIVKTFTDNDIDWVFSEISCIEEERRPIVIDDKYKDAIFCNKYGEIVIIQKGYIPTVDPYVRYYYSYRMTLSNQQQFKNIVNSLMRRENEDNLRVRTNIFFNPFDGDKNWQMPGISAFIKYKDTISNVYFAMKRPLDGYTEFWGAEDYQVGRVEKDFYNCEHTERQLILNHIVDETLCNDPKPETRNLILQKSIKHDLHGGRLFVWTHGNPCSNSQADNGNMCCMKYYDEVISKLLDRSCIILFSDFSHNEIDLKSNNENELYKRIDRLAEHLKHEQDAKEWIIDTMKAQISGKLIEERNKKEKYQTELDDIKRQIDEFNKKYDPKKQNCSPPRDEQKRYNSLNKRSNTKTKQIKDCQNNIQSYEEKQSGVHDIVDKIQENKILFNDFVKMLHEKDFTAYQVIPYVFNDLHPVFLSFKKSINSAVSNLKTCEHLVSYGILPLCEYYAANERWLKLYILGRKIFELCKMSGHIAFEYIAKYLSQQENLPQYIKDVIPSDDQLIYYDMIPL